MRCRLYNWPNNHVKFYRSSKPPGVFCVQEVFLTMQNIWRPIFYPGYFRWFSSKCVQHIMESDSANTTKIIVENTTKIFKPPGKNIFYNPVQEFNRDMSVLALKVFSKEYEKQNFGESKQGLRILEALSATGLRSIRYAKEVPNILEIIANDISENAVENIKHNVNQNNVENLVKPTHSDAMTVMFDNIHPRKRFNVVDLDPYGSPTQFLDLAVQCVADGGMLLITCTDMAVLCGNFPETGYLKYGAIPLKNPALHEMALRIVLHSIQSNASKYKRYIVPVLSISVDFYIRLFVKVYTSAATCKEVASKLSMVYECCQCNAITLHPLVSKINKNNSNNYAIPHVPNIGGGCKHCGGAHKMGGPIWNGPLHDQNFVSEMLNCLERNELGTSKRILGILSLIREELWDVPLYYVSDKLSSVLKCSQIPMKSIRSAILNAGYRVSFSHAAKSSIKTDAPMSFMWDLIKTWLMENAVKCKIIPGSAADKILNSPIQHEIDLSLRPDAKPLSQEKGLVRYQINPMSHWGPGSRSTFKELSNNPKKEKNQNKRKRRRIKAAFETESKKVPKLEDENGT